MAAKIIIFSLVMLPTIYLFVYIFQNIRDGLRRKTHRKYIQFILENSLSLRKLNQLNEQFGFHNDISDFDERHTYDNAFFYNNISCEDYLIYQLQFKKSNVQKAINNTEYNKKLYPQYQQEVDKIRTFGQYDNVNSKLNKTLLLKIEKSCFNEKVLKPKVTFSISITLTHGYYRSKQEVFHQDEILHLISRLNNTTNGFYNDRATWEALCRVERGRVSNRMRFSIYRRDGYKCCICGKHGSAEELEIDHIKPIAKGGKSTYDNLQTLCKKCNQQKGDTYPYTKIK